jgi:hypothetical protein
LFKQLPAADGRPGSSGRPLLRLRSTLFPGAYDGFIIGYIADYERSRPHDAIVADGNIVGYCGVDAQEARTAYLTVSRNDDVRGDKAVILYCRMVSDMIAAPQYGVGSDARIGLHCVVFENEAMLSDVAVVPDKGV